MSNMPLNNLLRAPKEKGAALAHFTETSRFVETREPWPVWYEGAGVRANGKVLGFSDAGWHMVGDAAVQPGASLALRVHLPDRPGLFCVPSATVQWAEGRAFVIRVQLKASA